MRRKLYILTLILLLIIPLFSIYLIFNLSPQNTNFPSELKLLFMLSGFFLVLLNQAIDYRKDNKTTIRFFFTALSFLPLLTFSFISISELIIETPPLIWITLSISVYGILINHTGFFSKNKTRSIERIALLVLITSLFLSFYALNSSKNIAFTLWLWSIYGSLAVTIAVLFNKKSATEV